MAWCEVELGMGRDSVSWPRPPQCTGHLMQVRKVSGSIFNSKRNFQEFILWSFDIFFHSWNVKYGQTSFADTLCARHKQYIYVYSLSCTTPVIIWVVKTRHAFHSYRKSLALNSKHFSLAPTVFEIFTFQNSWPWKCGSRSWCTTLAVSPFDGKYMTSYLIYSNVFSISPNLRDIHKTNKMTHKFDLENEGQGQEGEK